MKKIDNTFRSKVMKAAWTSFNGGKSANFSKALKSAWAWAKRTLREYAVQLGEVVRETEKAVLVRFEGFTVTGDDKQIDFWFPKSQVNFEEGTIAKWIFDQKRDELRREYNNYFQVEYNLI